MIISDLMKMVVVLAFMFYMNWTLTWIVIVAMPILVFSPESFKRKCKLLLRKCTQIANMNSFVQERVMEWRLCNSLIVKNWIRKVQTINNKHKTAWIKTILITPYFSYCWYYFVFNTWFYCALWIKILNGDTLPEIYFVHHVHRMLFNPLRQIADNSTKCNWVWLQHFLIF
jgi:ABC-type multidrug transport system fused ATPase/permease subunit